MRGSPRLPLVAGALDTPQASISPDHSTAPSKLAWLRANSILDDPLKLAIVVALNLRRTKVWNGRSHAASKWNSCVLSVAAMANDAIESKYTDPFINCFGCTVYRVNISAAPDRYVVLYPLDACALESACRGSAASGQQAIYKAKTYISCPQILHLSISYMNGERHSSMPCTTESGTLPVEISG